MDINDAKILDLIINTSLKEGRATNHNLPALENNYLSNQPEIKNNDYLYYIDLIQKYDVVRVTTFKGGFGVEPIPIKSKRFMENGGFEKLVNDSQTEEKNTKAKEEQETQIRELQIKELKGNIFQLKYWWLLILINAIISLIVALITA